MIDLSKSSLAIPTIDLDGKAAIITGSSRGLGETMAYVLAAYGASVAVNSRCLKDCEQVAERIREMGGTAIPVAADVRKREDVEALVARTEEAFGKVDIMVNNAGVSFTKKIVETTDEDWDDLIDTNLRGVFFGMAAAGKSMIKNGVKGRIINIASAAGFLGTKGISTYCVSKAGVISLSKSGALEFGRYAITVNAVCPGYIPTYLSSEAVDDPRTREKIIAKTALRRLGERDELAAVVLFMASDASSIITGAAIAADMGTTCNLPGFASFACMPCIRADASAAEHPVGASFPIGVFFWYT
jgi:NAD(P)-dependent dehydrogenase (short-subunit alcohol dehydrogenase family)